MLETNLIYTLIRTFPESIVIMLSGMILLGMKIEIKELLKKGILLGVIVGCIRLLLPISFGVHTILSMMVLGLMLYKMGNNELIKSIINTSIIWIALVLSEGIYVLLATGIVGIPIETLMDNKSAKGAIVTLPSLLITFGIVIILKKVKGQFEQRAIRG